MWPRVGRVVVVVGDWDAALGALAHDVGVPGMPLRVDEVVLLMQPLVGGGNQGRKLLDNSGAEGTLFTMREGWQHSILTASVVSATPG
jgi:hypothetical protein